MKYILGGGRSTTSSKLDKPVVASYAETETTPLLSQDAKAMRKFGIPLVGAGISTVWHEWQLSRVGRGKKPDMGMHWLWGGAVVEGVWWGGFKGGPWGWWRSRRIKETG